MIRRAELAKALKIYKFMEDDFASSEIPDYARYEKMTKENIHQVYLYEENEKDIAYFITLEKEGKVLITHLAVIKEYRGNGAGRRFLEAIKTFLADKDLIIVEVESERMAKNEQELDIIQKRLRYYLKAGFKKCEGMEYNLFNVDYDILIYGKAKEKMSNIEVKKTIEKLYDGLFPSKSLSIKIDF